MNSEALEVIDFSKPIENEKNLYLTNISADLGDDDSVQHTLRQIFSKYGFLYEVQVVETYLDPAGQSKGSYYAFVKFYSAAAAATAFKDLAGRLYLKGQHVRVRYASRKKGLLSNTTLFYTKCYELANHYLGFNGWSIKILSMKPDEGTVGPGVLRYFCMVALTLPRHGITTESVGVGEMSHNVQDPSTKSVAACRGQKRAYQQAVENAFSRVVMVVLPDGRVYADVKPTCEEQLEKENLLPTDGTLKVTELENDPGSGEESDTQADLDLDSLNKEILDYLEDG